jgi:hypothetical protein
LSNVSLCDEEDDPLEWMLFGTREEEMSPAQELPDCDENSFIQLQGLHWETDNTIKQRSSRVMNYKSSEVHDDYKHLFTSPIVSMFAVIPLVFWEVLSEEVNRYANDYIRSKKKRYVCGYRWRVVTIDEMLTYFGILLFSMLYPQTGRRVRSCWDNQSINPWTAHMSKSQYPQITSMLHFNNNSDINGLATDSLHKVRPLLEILKHSIGRYATFGSELSFNKATMACFSRYGRGLISFNPEKPTGKFHFKVYMLCCAITNLVYKICIHTKDGCDNDVNPAEEDYGESNGQVNAKL